jgi:hypothetical protein
MLIVIQSTDACFMDLPEGRIINSLILLAGITFLAVGVATGQLTTLLQIISEVLGAAIAG